MRYLFYIFIIFILATAGFLLLGQNKASVDISKPAIIINDRIITEDELEKKMAAKPHDMTDEQYIDSLIMQQLLIQEALAQNIHKEESFRRSVENFYEQSLVKILLDRKSREAEPEVTKKEVEKYIKLSGMEIVYTKQIFKTKQHARANTDPEISNVSTPFSFLSDTLQCIIIGLEPGQTSKPRQTDQGFVTYRLEKIKALKTPGAQFDMDKDRIKAIIADCKKEKLFQQWTDELRQNADIWRQK
jgi:parvulin-like peptidyl-prolyl isomerase